MFLFLCSDNHLIDGVFVINVGTIYSDLSAILLRMSKSAV